jgi:hypothetical protein
MHVAASREWRSRGAQTNDYLEGEGFKWQQTNIMKNEKKTNISIYFISE